MSQEVYDYFFFATLIDNSLRIKLKYDANILTTSCSIEIYNVSGWR